MKYSHRDNLEVLDVGGRVFVILEPESGSPAYVAIPVRRSSARSDAAAIAWILWPDRHTWPRVSVVPDGLKPGPYLAEAIAQPLTLDEAVPTPPEFLDWWRRICSGELQRGQLAGEGSAGDPLEHQPEEAKRKPRKRIGELAARYETDQVEGYGIRLEVGASEDA